MFFSMIFRHLREHRLRTSLTMLGMAVAILAFLLLRSVVTAWYRGVDGAADNRLVTRHAISLTFFLPVSYFSTFKRVPGVTGATHMTWFGGVYIDNKNFFPRFSVGPDFLEIHPEFLLTEDERLSFEKEKRAALVGRKLADMYGWRLGDQIPLKGNIFPGDWSFIIRGIYRGGKPATDETLMFFHHDYLNERLRKTTPRMADRVGSYVLRIQDPAQAAAISRAVDLEFENSMAETLTETEKSFQLGFVAMTKALLVVVEIISVVVVLVILTVLANTMAMSVRERTSEYVVLKTLGFRSPHIALLVLGESLLLSMAGGVLGVIITFPAVKLFGEAVRGLQAITIGPNSIAQGLAASALVGILAALSPMIRVMTTTIAAGLRRMG